MTQEQQLQHIQNRVDSIYTLLHGSAQESEPSGLVQKVTQNTRFREHWHKLFWIVITGFVGLGGSLIILLLKTL